MHTHPVPPLPLIPMDFAEFVNQSLQGMGAGVKVKVSVRLRAWAGADVIVQHGILAVAARPSANQTDSTPHRDQGKHSHDPTSQKHRWHTAPPHKQRVKRAVHKPDSLGNDHKYPADRHITHTPIQSRRAHYQYNRTQQSTALHIAAQCKKKKMTVCSHQTTQYSIGLCASMTEGKEKC
jgi:hypothetical protein